MAPELEKAAMALRLKAPLQPSLLSAHPKVSAISRCTSEVTSMEEAEKQFNLDDPRHHTTDMRRLLTAVIEHARRDGDEVSDPKAQALFETSAEVLAGIRKAFEDYEQRNERAWRKAS
jgi:predicted metal-dependent HD superfamily phosphohydrolase